MHPVRGGFFPSQTEDPASQRGRYLAVKEPTIEVTITIAAIVVPTSGDP